MWAIRWPTSFPIEPDRAHARSALGLGLEDEVVALLPGSRVSEVAHLAPRSLRLRCRIAKLRPQVRFVVPAAPGLVERIRSIAQSSGPVPHLQIVAGQSHTVLAACDVTLVASGTATLEAALFKRPMVIAYHMGRVSWQLMRRKRLQPWVGLPNILCACVCGAGAVAGRCDTASPGRRRAAVAGRSPARAAAPGRVARPRSRKCTRPCSATPPQ